MKILFLSHASIPDYQNDMLFHGLRSNYGDSVVDYPRLSYMYQSYGDVSGLYGKGFSLYGLLGDDSSVDRTNLYERAMNHEFDLVVYGSLQRNRMWFSKLADVYKRHEIIGIDGEDQSHFIGGMEKHCLYFKRELSQPHEGIFPIHFAIPQEKIGTLKPLMKKKFLARVDPRDRSTYVFEKEEDYYRDYAESLFAITMKKGGWDCLRHLEILANGTIPVFLDFTECPKTTCTNLPKEELIEALNLFKEHPEPKYWDSDEGHSVWLSLWRRIHLKFARHSTTRMLAQYVIETQQREAHV